MATDTRLYDILRIPPSASTSEIKKAYRILALKYHPDKNNHSEESTSKFQEICQAYEVLKDDRKRALYNQYGTIDEQAIQQEQQNNMPSFFTSSASANPMNMSAGDLFAHFFDNVSSSSSTFNTRRSNMPGSSSTISRGPDIKHDLKCSLAELYDGKKTKLGLNRKRLCKLCQGYGGTKCRTCKACGGQGQQTETRRMGPMVQTWTQTCNQCGGTGTFMKNTDTCGDCHGEGYIRERRILDVEVIPGMCHGQIIILPGEADEVITTSRGNQKVIPGDVVITIKQSKDDKFQRVNKGGCDLVMRKCKIPLTTSLCGGDVYIDGHPNGKVLKVSIIPGEIIRPNCFKSIEGMGMPKYNCDTNGAGLPVQQQEAQLTKGNLYILFQVDFPEKLEQDTITKLMDVFANDPNIKQQIAAQDDTFNKELDDCVEIEDRVLSSFVPDLSAIINDKNDKRSNPNSRKWGNKKRRYYSKDESEQEGGDDDSATDQDMVDIDQEDSNNCTIH